MQTDVIITPVCIIKFPSVEQTMSIITLLSYFIIYTFVWCAVVDKDDIEISISLLKDGAGAPLDIFLHAVYRHENADCVGFLCHSDSFRWLMMIGRYSLPLNKSDFLLLQSLIPSLTISRTWLGSIVVHDSNRSSS